MLAKASSRKATLIYNYLYDAKGNQRCIPVFLGDNASSDIPAIFNGYTRFQITALSLDDPQSSYANLYRLLTRQSTAQKAELGALHKLSALPPRKRLTDFTDLIDQILAGIGEILSILKKGNRHNQHRVMHGRRRRNVTRMFGRAAAP